MKYIKPKISVEPFNAEAMLRKIERAGRTCYKSQAKITAASARTFVKMLVKLGHESAIEHASITIRITCDRGISHELVRHRLASFSQESTRYVNYYQHGLRLISPDGLTVEQKRRRSRLYRKIEKLYNREISEGIRPQISRGLLPQALATEIVMTANLREWRHFLRMRDDAQAHPQMREIAEAIRKQLAKRLPEVFADIMPFSTLMRKLNDTVAPTQEK